MKKILIINANYYKDITKNLENAAKKVLKNKNFQISLIKVPGVFETPIAIRKNIENKISIVILISIFLLISIVLGMYKFRK